MSADVKIPSTQKVIKSARAYAKAKTLKETKIVMTKTTIADATGTEEIVVE